ncbi:polyprenyl synthetase family protein [Streptomyces sp. NPDC017095]|uniref:polyprenyl synthetase family protein n=1 Tax=Streptomyces sp. NPDC017095 TaxID=3364977 RepID=UPI00378D228F
MRAFQLARWRHPPELREVSVPEPGPGHVLVKVAGACHADPHIMEAPGPPPGLVTELPFTLGHENAGWGERLGTGVTGLTPGDPVSTGSRTAEEIFDAGGKLIDPAVRALVERLPSPLLDAVRHHYGWAGRNGGPVTGQPGGVGRRGLVLPLLCAGVDGRPVERGLAATVVGDLLVNTSIIHDDVLGRDPVRCGRPALWAAYGTECALMVGDALLGLAFSLLGERSHPRTHQALRMMSGGWSRLCAGQMGDSGQEGRTETSLEQAIAVHEAKAADGLRAVFRLPVLFTDATSEQVEAVGRYGFHCAWPPNTSGRRARRPPFATTSSPPAPATWHEDGGRSGPPAPEARLFARA